MKIFSLGARSRDHSLALLFALTLLLSALLLFSVQLVFGKLLLPMLGGSPAVWNTCMVFYQTMLFAGYAYAHLLASRCNVRRQILIHGAILLLSGVSWPVALSASTPPSEQPVSWLLGMLFGSLGMPFFALATTAPLLQRWFVSARHRASGDPYFLYVASNAGSLLALLAYPFVIEPHWRVSEQLVLWNGAYLLLGALIAGCGAVVWRGGAVDTPVACVETQDSRIPARRGAHWLLLSAVPSSLLLGVTHFISTDVAAVPLLWIIPLALYLSSFMLAFSHWNPRILPHAMTLQALWLLPLIAFAFINPSLLTLSGQLTLHLVAFWLACMVCHGELARQRPDPQHLTLFYLLLSLGGLLGGVFNGLLAPLLFDDIHEYPLMIVLALLLRPGGSMVGRTWRETAREFWPTLLLLAGAGLIDARVDTALHLDALGVALILLTGFSYSLRASPWAMGSFAGALLALALGLHASLSDVLERERTFFGVHAVRASVMTDERGAPERYHELYHGTTKHGAQRLTEEFKRVPWLYYSQPGPIGQLFARYAATSQHWRIGVVGLGTGALACYARAGQQWTFYEIDPTVVRLARDPRYFSYLADCLPQAAIELGDARLSLQRVPDDTFDLLVLDAFSSDAIPTHLLTTEALEVYWRKLKREGLLALHITNRHLALKKLLGAYAEAQHVAGLLQEYTAPPDHFLIVDADWVVLAREAALLAPLRDSGAWRKLPLVFDVKPWTDDYSALWGLWK